jgi:peptidoglycan/LPS O-acetylase OafA/YrhL
MGDWYTIGVALGLGVACGVLLAAILASSRWSRLAAVVLAAAAGAVVGFLVEDWEELVAGGIAGPVAAASALVFVLGARRRGGTRGGLALIVAAFAVGLAVFAFVPVVGYLAAIGVPLLAVRLRRTKGDRYAGLRSLARD